MTSPGVDAITEMLDKAFADGMGIKGATEETVAKINGQIAAMMTRFQGIAPAVFTEKYGQWQIQMGTLINELDRISRAAKASADAQRQLEADSQATINSVV